MISSIRTYKMARTYRNVVLSYISVSETAMAECLAFNQTIGFAGESPLSTDMVKYINFYRKHRDFYVGAEDVAPVAVLHSYPSITYNNAGPGLSAILFEQALIQARIPFRLIFDEHLSELSPSNCRVLVLPNAECLSDEQLAAIRQYVAKGGGLVGTEQTGFYDAWRRRREEPGLKDLMGNQTSVVRGSHVKAQPAIYQKEYGQGRVAYIPSIEFDGTKPVDQPYFTVGVEFWKRPQNWEELIEAVIWAAGSELPISVAGPDFLAMNLVEQTDKRRRIIHLVNFDAEQSPSVQNVSIRCSVGKGEPPSAVNFYSPDFEGGRLLDFRMQNSQAVFSVPTLNTYGVVTVSW